MIFDLQEGARAQVEGQVLIALIMTIFMFLGVLRALYVKQKAAPHPPLHPADEAQPHPLLHQLQRDCTQVGEHHTS